MSSTASKRRIGIVGFGHLGQYLTKAVQENDKLDLAFVWNRSPDAMMGKVDEKYILRNLEDFKERSADLIVEVAHPCIAAQYGEVFLEHADFMVGSPTAFADAEVERRLCQKAQNGSHGLYIPSGALWGAQDIKKMADRGTLKGLKITMKKHPSSFKLEGYLHDKNKQVSTEATVIYEGSVRDLCPLAPNNVNTMAAAAMAAHNLGMDTVQGCLVSDPSLDAHIVEIDVFGPGSEGNQFSVKTVKSNPAPVGAVSGSATYASFLSSLLASHNQGNGIHLC